MTMSTMEDAVVRIIESQIEGDKAFSAHTVTQILREEVNTQKTQIDGLDMEQVEMSDGTVIDTQPIDHHEVRSVVKGVMRNDPMGYTSTVVDGFIAYHDPSKDEAQLRQEFGLPEDSVDDDSDEVDDDTSLSSIVGDTASDDNDGGSGLLKRFGN